MKLIPGYVLEKESGKISYIVIHDFAKIREVFDFTTIDGPEHYAINVLSRKTGVIPSGFISGLDQYAIAGPIRKSNIGYDALNIDAAIYSWAIFSSVLPLEKPPETFQALIGRFDPESTRAAFAERDGWVKSINDSYAFENYQNILLYSWGDGHQLDLSRKLTPPHIDFLGRARPLAVTENNVFYSDSITNLKSIIDTSSKVTATSTRCI
jgi:hypothetical protein